MRSGILVSLAAVMALGQTAPPKTHLKAGDEAPDFRLRATDGKEFRLSEHRGKTVVVAFFPAAFTGGCTKEMTAYQADLAEFEKAGAVVIGVSTDNLPSLRHWAQEVLKLSFPLASDFSRREVARAYGVLNEQTGIANRTTFVIGPDGRIVHIDEGAAALDPEGALTVCRRTKRP